MSDSSEVGPRGLPPVVLVIAAVVAVAVSIVIGAGVLMANAMSCDSGGEGCADRVVLATVVWGVLAFIGPLAAMTWGLLSPRGTRGGRTMRVIALLVIIALPFVSIAVNLALIFSGPHA